jgi:hypothetical protein
MRTSAWLDASGTTDSSTIAARNPFNVAALSSMGGNDSTSGHNAGSTFLSIADTILVSRGSNWCQR